MLIILAPMIRLIPVAIAKNDAIEGRSRMEMRGNKKDNTASDGAVKPLRSLLGL